MSGSTEWEDWLRSGGLEGLSDGDTAAAAGPHVEDDLDDPWGGLDLELTLLTDDQRRHLELGIPGTTDEGPGGFEALDAIEDADDPGGSH